MLQLPRRKFDVCTLVTQNLTIMSEYVYGQGQRLLKLCDQEIPIINIVYM